MDSITGRENTLVLDKKRLYMVVKLQFCFGGMFNTYQPLGGKSGEGRDVLLKEVEQGHTLYCDATDYVPL